jgi:tripartite ATP-independent transporter DctM subunit
MTAFFIATALLIITLLMGIPIAFAMGITTVIYILMTEPQYIAVIPIRMFEGVDSFILMAIPLFVLAGEIMVNAGISNRLFDFVRLFLGRIRGGLAYVNVVASTIFGSLSGAALADVAGLGKVEIEAMKEDGYKEDFACAITAASSLQSPLIPPSNIVILYGGIMGISIGALLLAGLVPGLLLGASQIVYIAFNTKRMNLPKDQKKYSKAEIIKIARHGLIALMMPFIIIGGILSGMVTPTEAAGLAVFYAIIVALLIYRNVVHLGDFINSLWNAVKTSANLFMIIAFATTFAWVMGVQKVPDQLACFLMRISNNPTTLFFIINIILLIIGMWMDCGAALILFAPILGPIMYKVGIHPVHFAIVMILNLTVGLITPPIGVVLYATASVGKIKFEKLVKACLPLISMAFIILAVVTYIPEITLFVPRLFGLIK